jgi:serine/threonine protein kinase/tetratricopeptide (TPR) repeat protein
MAMSAGGNCGECGAAIPADSPGGFCPQCLLRLGMLVEDGGRRSEDAGRKTEDGGQRTGDGGQRTEDGGQEPEGEAASLGESSAPTRAGSVERGDGIGLPEREKPGDRIGRYRLLQEIGQGGCGVVYMAEQEEPVRRKVALKVIKLGMDTKQVVARFDAERQALALMDHPNIARVLDAGATDAGRPYFVMELVGGIRITDYCDHNHLTTRQRLDLFIQVCRAIQHAHQKGVIHRDIKPSNILVAMQDGESVPKVIDFGIAKATQGRLTDQTLFTAYEQFLGTPAYMSPEQTQLGSLDVDTRSDIYSLGVLLYELLTGTTPFDTKALVAAGLDEMRRTIREVEPVKPSTRLTQEIAAALELERDAPRAPSSGENATERGAHGVARPTNKSAIDRDLDWIVMKCLEKDRARRYETANGLGSDVQRHLNNEPVVARPPSKLYEFQKTVRRHKVGFAATAAIILALAIGAAVSTGEAMRAIKAEREQIQLRQQAQAAQGKEANERVQAVAEAARSQQVARFLEDMLNGVGPAVAEGRDTTLLREILQRTQDRVPTDLQTQPQVAAELLNTIGRVYVALGESARAEQAHRQARGMCEQGLGEDNPELAVSLLGLAQARAARGDLSEAEALDRKALAICRRIFPEGHQHYANSLNDLSRVLESKGQITEAELLQQEALDMQRKLWGDQNAAVALSLKNLGIIRDAQGRHQEAEQLMTQSLAIMRKAGTQPGVAWSLEELANVLAEEGKLVEAEGALKETLGIQRTIYGETNRAVMNTLLNLGDVLTKEGKRTEAELDVAAAITIQRNHPQEERSDPNLSFWFGAVFQKMGRFAEAEEWYSKAVQDDLKTPRLSSPSRISLVHALVTVLRVEGKSAEIQASYIDWLQGIRAQPPAADPEMLVHLLSDLALTLMDGKKYAESEGLARECLAIHEKHISDDWWTYRARNLLGGCLLAREKYAEAEPLLLSAQEGFRRHETEIPAERKQRMKEVLQRLTQLYEATGRPDQAADWKAKLDEFERTQSENLPAGQSAH